MPNPYILERIENWVSDFCASDDIREFDGGTREYAPEILKTLLAAACDVRGVEPDEIEDADLKVALIEHIARLQLPSSVRKEIPALCAAFLTQLETAGRLGGGRVMGAYVRALSGSFEATASGKPAPITRPGSRIGRNNPCPCGSGKKYKKCCG